MGEGNAIGSHKGRVQKTKWKFLMAFAMKGGRGSRVPLTFFDRLFWPKVTFLFPNVLRGGPPV